MRILVAAALALLAGCAGPSITAFNDRGGIIHYHMVNASMADVLAVAERYCGQVGRKAKLGTPAIGWDAWDVSFECVK